MTKVIISIFSILFIIGCNSKPKELADFERKVDFYFPQNIKIDTNINSTIVLSFDNSTEKIIVEKIIASKNFDKNKDFDERVKSANLMQGFWSNYEKGYIYWRYFNENRKLVDYSISIDTLLNKAKLEIEYGD